MMLGQEALTPICNMKHIRLLGEQAQEMLQLISMVTKNPLLSPTQASTAT
jgi:hypothetical protein